MSELIPHRLATVDALIDTNAANAQWLGYTLEGWRALDDRAAAFVFPSEPLARRYASALLAQSGVTFVPLPAADAEASLPPAHHCRACGCTETFACPRGCSWHEPDLCSECARADEYEIWVVTENPADYPGKFVARRTVLSIPTREVLVADSIDELRAKAPRQITVLARQTHDPAVVVETWL